MNADELRALQAPLKQRYRESPAHALIPARAEGIVDVDGVACKVSAWRGVVDAGLHPAGGGSGELACSADLLLQALVACAGVTLASVATAMGLELRGARVIAEGTWDARGTLAVDRAAPVGITDVTLSFEIDTDAPPDKVERLVASAERYCVIAQTLRTPPTITVKHSVVRRA